MTAATVSDLRLTPCLTPHGHLLLAASDDAPALEPALGERIRQAFDRGAGHGLLRLGAAEVGQVLPPVFVYWREFGGRYVTALCSRPDLDEHRAEPPPPPKDIAALAAAAPMMPGAEYLTTAVMLSLWAETGKAFATEQAEAKTTVQDFLRRLNPAWNVVGKVHFNLAENRKDEQAPFAFLATYTARLSAHGKAQHLPLGQALREYAGAANKERLLSLCSRFNARPSAAPGSSRWSTRARSFIRCAGRRRRLFAFSATYRSWSAPASSFACPRPGEPGARTGRRRLPPSGRRRRPRLGRMRCSTSAWRSRLTATG